MTTGNTWRRHQAKGISVYDLFFFQPGPEALYGPDIGIDCDRTESSTIAFCGVLPSCFGLQSYNETAQVIGGYCGNIIDAAKEFGKEAYTSGGVGDCGGT